MYSIAMTGKYKSDGATLAYRDAGSGLPIVFLHPTPLDGEYWGPLAARLTSVRAIVPDLRGHGCSELGTLPKGGFEAVSDAPVLTMARLAADVLALLDHLGISTAVFAGCSIGGYVLLELWRQAPERVRGLAFICSKPQPDTPADHARRAGLIAEARSVGSAEIFEGMAQTLIGASARKIHPEIVAQLRAHMTLTPEALEAVQAGLATRPDSMRSVETIDVPILAIAGGEDTSITSAEMEAFHAALGGCEFHLLPEAGHFAAYEHPQSVAALIEPWIRQFQ